LRYEALLERSTVAQLRGRTLCIDSLGDELVVKD
jgi:hypothetical protein